MNFKSIEITNFRNFKHINISLSNKNLFFGMNDVGKTNFLYALRFIFDREVRKNQFQKSDYYKKNTNVPICIIVEIDLSDNEDEDCQKLRARLKGNMTSDSDIAYIKLVGEFDVNESSGNPVLYWGNDLNSLGEVQNHGIYSDLDYVFKVFYIDAYVDVYSLFKKNTNKLINSNDDDYNIYKKIDNDIDVLNSDISSLSGIVDFEKKLNPEFQKYRGKDVSVTVKSEIAIKGLYNNVVPYIKNNNDKELYPTAGEGRKKLLAYSLYDLLVGKLTDSFINIFLIEEPENNLHKSLQKMLSKILFAESKYKYLFMTTHSSSVLAEMDSVNLVRIFNENKIDSKSIFYNVPDEYLNLKKTFNNYLSESLFADIVLLVEGPSEQILFEKVLSVMNPDYEVNGAFILPVDGIRFDDYYRILNALGIKCIIKTDNDLRFCRSSGKYSVLGFSRVNNLIGEKKLPEEQICNNSDEAKRRLYDGNLIMLNEIRSKNKVFLSRCSLEQDLDEIMHDSLVLYLPDSNGDVVSYMKDAKQFRMAELVKKMNDEDCKRIYNHYNFECLKEVK